MSAASYVSANGLPGEIKSASIARPAPFFLRRAFLMDCAALAVILLMTLAYFKHDIFDGQIYFEPDTTSYYYPVMSAVDGAIKNFSIPLWTPYIFGGFPLFADGEAGMLYPLNLLLMWLFAPQQVLILGRVIRFFLGGSFMYAYLRSLSVSRTSSLLAGLVFSFGSFMVVQLHHSNVGNSAIWLPLILFFTELGFQAKGSRRLLFLLLAGVSLGIQNLGIHIQPVLLTLFTFFFYVPFRTLFTDNSNTGQGPRARFKLLLTAWIIVPAVGLGLAAIQLLPLYDLGTFSFRGESPSYFFATSFSLPLQNIITLVLPYFFERTDGSSWSLWVEWESTVYAGIIPLVLAILAVIRSGHRLTKFYASLSLVSLLLAFGDYLPVKLYWLLWNLPGFMSLRVPSRFTYLFIFSIAVLAAIGFDWLSRAMAASRAWEAGAKRGPGKWFVWLNASVLICCALLVGCLVWLRVFVLENKDAVIKFLQSNYLVMRSQDHSLSADTIYNSLKVTLDLGKPTTLQPIVLLAMLAVLLLVWRRFRSRSHIWRTMLLAFVAVDLMLFAWRFHPTATWDAVSNPSGPVRFLMQENGLHRVYNRYTGLRSEPNRLMPFKVSTVGGYSSLEVERTKKFMRAIDRGNTRLLDLGNVRYVVGKATQPPISSSLPVVYQEGDVAIFENKSYMPRSFVVDSYLVASSGDSALGEMESSDFNPASTVVLEEDPRDAGDTENSFRYSVANAKRQSSILSSKTKGTADIYDYTREDILVNADVGKSSFLVLTDSFYPGWKAYVDGQDAKIYRADYLFRAIYLPPGLHSIEFVFKPTDFEIGRSITILTIIITSLAFVYVVARCRRERPAGASL